MSLPMLGPSFALFMLSNSVAFAQNVAGSWSGSISCSWGSGSLSFSVDQRGGVAGSGTNLQIVSGTARGRSISFETTNFFGNRATYQGVISGGQMSGTYTQAVSSETCKWRASLIARAAPVGRDDSNTRATADKKSAKEWPTLTNRIGGAILGTTKRLLIDPALKTRREKRFPKSVCCGIRG